MCQIIYCGCQANSDMERHNVLALEIFTWSTLFTMVSSHFDMGDEMYDIMCML